MLISSDRREQQAHIDRGRRVRSTPDAPPAEPSAAEVKCRHCGRSRHYHGPDAECMGGGGGGTWDPADELAAPAPQESERVTGSVKVDGLTVTRAAHTPNLVAQHARDSFCITPAALAAMNWLAAPVSPPAAREPRGEVEPDVSVPAHYIRHLEDSAAMLPRFVYALATACTDYISDVSAVACVLAGINGYDGEPDIREASGFSVAMSDLAKPSAPAGQPQQSEGVSWSAERQPNDQVSYNHVIGAAGPIRLVLEWKAWKERPSFSLEVEWVPTPPMLSARSVDEAKAEAEAWLRSALATPSAEREP